MHNAYLYIKKELHFYRQCVGYVEKCVSFTQIAMLRQKSSCSYQNITQDHRPSDSIIL